MTKLPEIYRLCFDFSVFFWVCSVSVFVAQKNCFCEVFFKYSNWVFVSGMGNVSTRKDGVEECEDFDQSMESSAGGTHGEC